MSMTLKITEVILITSELDHSLYLPVLVHGALTSEAIEWQPAIEK
jgi:hypothetical protein